MKYLKLKDIGIILTGNTPKTSDPKNYCSNGIPFVKPSDISQSGISRIAETEFYISDNARKAARIIPANSVLTTCIGIIGKVGINKNVCSFNQQINAVIPNQNIVLPNYLAYAIFSKKNELQNIANAPVVPIINKTKFSEFKIPNIKIDEQQKIANILDAIQDQITIYRDINSRLDQLVKARFVEMFGNIHAESKWKKESWSELVTIQNGRDYKKIQVKTGGYPVYGTGGEIARASGYLCPENSIIIGRKGTINNPLLIKEKFWNVDTAFGVIPNNNLHYLYFFNFCRMFDFSSLNKQAVLPSTTKTDLLKIKIAVPPMKLQQEFATFVNQVDKSKFAVQKSLEKTQLLFDSLMQQYFG